MRKLNDWLQSYMEYTAYSEAPEHFHFWTGVGVVAGALRRKVWLDMKYFQWTPNFYIIFVAPPGIVTKSTALGVGKSLLTALQGIKFGPSALTWQAMITALAASTEGVQMPDGTIHPMSCLSFFVSELGTFLDTQDRKMIDVLVDLWDGQRGAWEKATKTVGSDSVQNPWLNIIGGTTPVWLNENVPRTMIGGGFTARCVFIFGETKRHLIAYPQLVVPPVWFDEMTMKLVHDLEQIAMLRGEFLLTPEAYLYGEEWYKQHYSAMKKAAKSSNDFGGYIARKQAHVHKLAMVLSASRRDDMVITEKELQDAVLIMDGVEKDLPEIFKSLTTSQTMDKAIKLIEVVKLAKSIRRAELYQLFFHVLDSKQFTEILDSAIQAGYLQAVVRGNTVFIEMASGAPSQAAPAGAGTAP